MSFSSYSQESSSLKVAIEPEIQEIGEYASSLNSSFPSAELEVSSGFIYGGQA